MDPARKKKRVLQAIKRAKKEGNSLQNAFIPDTMKMTSDDLEMMYECLKESGVTEQLTKFSLIDTSVQVLPKWINKLNGLKELLYHGGINELPWSIIECNQLTSLDISHNTFSDWPLQISSLTQLKQLDLSYSSVRVATTKTPTDIHINTNPVSQNLISENNIYTHTHTNSIISSGSDEPILEDDNQNFENSGLLLEHSRIPTFTIPRLAFSVSSMRLESLSLCSIGIEELPESIASLKYLTYLDVSYNNLSSLPRKLGKLEELGSIIYLAHNHSSLKSLPISAVNSAPQWDTSFLPTTQAKGPFIDEKEDEDEDDEEDEEDDDDEKGKKSGKLQQPSSLLHIAASFVLNEGIPYNNITLTRDLCEFLEDSSWHRCECHICRGHRLFAEEAIHATWPRPDCSYVNFSIVLRPACVKRWLSWASNRHSQLSSTYVEGADLAQILLS